MTSWIKCMPPEMQVKHTEPTKTKSWSGELREKETLVQSLLKSKKVWLDSVAFGSLSNSGALFCMQARWTTQQNPQRSPRKTSALLLPHKLFPLKVPACTPAYWAEHASTCLHPFQQKGICVRASVICQVGERDRSHHHDIKLNAVGHTENNRKEITKTSSDLLAAHPHFQQNKFLAYGQIFLAH